MFNIFDVPRALNIKRLLFSIALLPLFSLIASIVLAVKDVGNGETVHVGSYGFFFDYIFPLIFILFFSPFMFLLQRKWGIVNPQIAIYKGLYPVDLKEGGLLYIFKMAAIAAFGVFSLLVCVLICFWQYCIWRGYGFDLIFKDIYRFSVSIGIALSSFNCFWGSLIYLYISRTKYKPSDDFIL